MHTRFSTWIEGEVGSVEDLTVRAASEGCLSHAMDIPQPFEIGCCLTHRTAPFMWFGSETEKLSRKGSGVQSGQ